MGFQFPMQTCPNDPKMLVFGLRAWLVKRQDSSSYKQYRPKFSTFKQYYSYSQICGTYRKRRKCEGSIMC